MTETLEQRLRRLTAPAELSEPADGGALRCLACSHRCRIAPGRSGVCRVRFNEGGRLMAPWGYVAGLQLDPIEKKPFYHVAPGSPALSFGMLGCNLRCGWCQNWLSSQTLQDPEAGGEPAPATPEDLVRQAVRRGARSVISTYNEPLVTAEWAAAIFREAKRAGLLCGFVSNGHATPRVLEALRPCCDLYKVDLKCFDAARYRSLGGRLQDVQDTIVRLKELGFWVEVVTLLVPGFNDGEPELSALARWLASVSRDIPWHVTAFQPRYRKMDAPPTGAQALERAAELARAAGLRYVYAGNRPGRVGGLEDTRCPSCAAVLVERVGFRAAVKGLRVDGASAACAVCKTAIPGVWS